MSTYRKIEAEVRDEDTSTTISYSKARKEDKVTEKVFIKKKQDRKTVSEVRGTSVDGNDWEIKGKDSPVDYKKYSPDGLFKEFGFIDLDGKKIGGGIGGSMLGWLVVLVIVLALWFTYEYISIYIKLLEMDNKNRIFNENKPKSQTRSMQDLSFSNIYPSAIGYMFMRIGFRY